jgi:NAD(P)-dependent dehydrogenase (short-subunit alcohol dehydrogenase family)
VHHAASDVVTIAGCGALADVARDVFDSRLDVLVNNAGAAWGEDPGYDDDDDDDDRGRPGRGRGDWGWDRVLDCNVKGVFHMTREYVSLLQRRHRRPAGAAISSSSSSSSSLLDVDDDDSEAMLDPRRVINIGSVAGILPHDAPTHAYDISKAAVHHLTKKWRATWRYVGSR